MQAPLVSFREHVPGKSIKKHTAKVKFFFVKIKA